jgi:hypothetical protein
MKKPTESSLAPNTWAFEIAQIISTADGGLAVCGTTYLAGRFPRICIIKLDKDQLPAV